MEVVLTDVAFLGGTAPWWVPLLTVGAFSTAFAYLAMAVIALLGMVCAWPTRTPSEDRSAPAMGVEA